MRRTNLTQNLSCNLGEVFSIKLLSPQHQPALTPRTAKGFPLGKFHELMQTSNDSRLRPQLWVEVFHSLKAFHHATQTSGKILRRKHGLFQLFNFHSRQIAILERQLLLMLN